MNRLLHIIICLFLLSILNANDNKESDDPVILYFTGDVTLSDHFEKYVGNRYDYPFSKLSWLKEADVFMVNLENPLTVRGEPRPKLFNFRAKPEYVKALKHGGFIVSYSPTMPQVIDFVNAVSKEKDLIHLKTLELIQREWELFERKVRPKTTQTVHTGFLSFIRRI